MRVVGVVKVAGLFHPFRRHNANRLQGQRSAFPFPCACLRFVDLEGSEVIAVVAVEFGPGETGPRLGVLPHPHLAGFIVALCMEGLPPQLGNRGQLVDADRSFEHGVMINVGEKIVILNDNPLGNCLRTAPLIAMGQRRCALLDHPLVSLCWRLTCRTGRPDKAARFRRLWCVAPRRHRSGAG